ncbi:hypothetical protein BIY26_03030 [Brenneria goodwinii]|uniref:Type III secretion injected virulence protein (YopP,YopJ, induces apoptosis, prevents cytokine induction, inhibits NFkb activation) n=1 Tax=Brenneria goodwinii TaxID=1109412 RepID=A0A0G4JVB0_9GAMM|nr:YopJ family type III secretion system effector XopJ [Brenneria goodwinii]ATA26360.1 hypothetical protein AWC36_20865 [Brenneria goodwinii]MCG8158189.1 peptidase C55 [Brenneria goodwinii]MCG8162635.1 peptidase C55 [Brenneria goodwinii]MCG8167239.1 peptidase C55 [Brenneria goodwinii]MCG8171925.1 peptidase C55 [Brenneria goodwinii]
MGVNASKPSGGLPPYNYGFNPYNQDDYYRPPSPERSSSYAASNPPDFDSLPERAAEKARALSNALNMASLSYSNPELAHYARKTLEQASSGQTTVEITNLDIGNIRTLVNTYNDRFSSLNLKYFSSQEDFLDELRDTDTSAWRAILKAAPNSRHHFAIDIRTHDDGQKTLIALEPSVAFRPIDDERFHSMPGYYSLHRGIQRQSDDDVKFAVIQTEAQKSTQDCVIFSLNFALNAYQKDSFFDDLHDNLKNNEPRLGTSATSYHSMTGLEYIEGKEILPAIFFKHSHSRAIINEVLDAQPDLSDRNVSTNRESPHETLSERVQAFRVHREDLSYSMSIEASRMRKIRKAIENAS